MDSNTNAAPGGTSKAVSALYAIPVVAMMAGLCYTIYLLNQMISTDGFPFPTTALVVYILCCVIGILAIVMAIVSMKHGNELGVLVEMFAFKVIPVTFYVIVFQLACVYTLMTVFPSAMLFFMSFNPLMFGIGALPAIIFGLIDICLFVPGAVSGVAYVNVLYKNGKTDKKGRIIHSVLQCIFVLDIFDTIVLLFRNAKNRALGIASIVLTLLPVILGIACVIFTVVAIVSNAMTA